MAAVFQPQYGPAAIFSQQYGSLSSQVSVNSEMLYAIKGAVVEDILILSDVLSTVESQYGHNYTIRQELTSDDSLIYNVLSAGQVTIPTVISYNIRTDINSSNNFSWYVRTIESTTNGIIYTVRGKIEGSSEEITYKIHTSTTSTEELGYEIKGFESSSRFFEYNILGLSQVKKDLPLLYNVLSSVLPNWTDVYLKSDGDGVFTVILK